MDPTLLAYPLLGLAAGGLTTVAGLGGGMFIVLVLSLFGPPAVALAVSSPALLVGNLHRAILFRRKVDRGAALRFGVAALPASAAGGLLLPHVPELALRAVFAVVAALGVGMAVRKIELRAPRWALTPAGAGVGLLTGTSGGAGVLVAPSLLAIGLSGEAFVATGAALSLAMHTGRIAAYGAGGLFTAERALAAAALAIGLVAGNAAGKRLRAKVPEGWEPRIEASVLAIVSALAALGLA